jgi:hypothetical protein
MIVQLNIRHFRDLLRTETDPAKRNVVSKLLAEEEAKLAALAVRDDKFSAGRMAAEAIRPTDATGLSSVKSAAISDNPKSDQSCFPCARERQVFERER